MMVIKNSSFLFICLTLLHFSWSVAQVTTYRASLRIWDEGTGKPLGNAQISIDPCTCGGVTDKDGFFSIVLPAETYTVEISYVGYKTYSQQVVLDQDVFWEVMLQEKEEQLSEVVVRARNINRNLESPQMGVVQLSPQELKKLPAALGEVDVLKGMTLLAGINNAGDISNGISVRGGSLDQNLLLFDYAPVFNPTHLFGLFSVFTPDVISSVDLYKANIPSRYGGRVASVLDIKVKNPYVDKFKLSGGIGLISSRLMVETPIVKDKLMLAASARAGFTDFLLPLFSERLKDTQANFSDATLKLLYLPTQKDQISLTGFYSKDFYELDLVSRVENVNAETNQYDFGTLNGTLNWVHSFNEKNSLRTVLVNSHYSPRIIFPEFESTNEIEYQSKINYLSLISEFNSEVKKRLNYTLGLQANRYRIDPGNLDPGGSNSVLPISLEKETSYELSGYANANWEPSNILSFSAGLRYNHFLFVGPFTRARYDSTGNTIIDTEFFDKGEKVQTYDGIEPRLGVVLKMDDNTSIKASYARINQYLQNVYNNTTPLPTSRWKTSDPNIRPQIADTYGLGLYRSLGDIDVSLEGYYRDTRNVLTYKPGADFFLEEFLERDVVQGKGQAYGAELSFRKSVGKVNGWVNYTWSRSRIRSVNEALGDRINNNQWFPSDFERPHVFNGTINFEGNKYNTFSFNFTAQSGRPFTVPNSVVQIEEVDVPIFLERNNSRLPIYHRLDFSWNINFSKSKNKKRWQNDWTFTIYNLYSRNNPFNVYYTQRTPSVNDIATFLDSPLAAFQLSILNAPLISLTYNFTFQ